MFLEAKREIHVRGEYGHDECRDHDGDGDDVEGLDMLQPTSAVNLAALRGVEFHRLVSYPGFPI